LQLRKFFPVSGVGKIFPTDLEELTSWERKFVDVGREIPALSGEYGTVSALFIGASKTNSNLYGGYL
jgi:hypothetical protein